MKKRIFSSLLALITLLALLPTAMAASFPPSDSPYWTSVSDQEGYNMLSSLSKSGDLVFVFYGTDCPRSARQVPEMADYLNEIGVHAYAFSCAQGESSQVAYAISRMFNSLPAWPVVVLYSASSGKVGAYGNCDLEHLKEGLQNYGLYDVSNDPGSDDSDGDNGDNSLPLYYDSSIDSAAWEVLRLTNQHRMSMGLDPLSTTDAMQMAANQRAEELTVQYNADHSRPDGSECYTVLKDYGISYNSAAENIAYGYSSAAAVMDGWLNSSGHRKNIETAYLVHLGVGHASSYWAQDFIGSSSCSYSGLSLSRSSVTGEVGQDLEDILTDADITVTANCSKHGASYLPLIADMCTGYRADAAGTQTITVSLDGRSTTLTVTLAANCTEHVYDSGTVTKAATCTAEGVMTYTCVICGETKTETIPKTAHTPNSQGVCTVCGQTVSTPSTQQPTTTQQPATVPAGESTGAVGQTGTLAAGDFHAGAIGQNGALWMWGYGSYGRLGTGTAENAPTPVKVLDNVASVSCGRLNTAAIKTDGTLWMWGYASAIPGGTGNQTIDGHLCQTVPVKVLDNVTAVSCGHYHTAAIKTDGSLWVWGSNFAGQLGTGTLDNSPVPVKVLDNVAAVSCGDSYTAAIKTDGTLWMWGDNTSGQLGNGGQGNHFVLGASTEVYQTVPEKVLDNVAAVSCGETHTAAIKTDGTLWTWGSNDNGQLGVGTTTDSLVPVKVLDHAASVSCGGNHTAAIKTDGTLWAWGDNWNFQLGNGFQSDDSLVPIQVLDNAASVGCGDSYTAAVKRDGTLWTWGSSKYGQLGTGTAADFHGSTQVAGLTVKLSPAAGTPATTSTPTAPGAPAKIAYATSYSILVDGKTVAFDAYALRDENGNDTNYLKLRDVAHVLSGSAAQFNVGYDAVSRSISITTGAAYTTPNGSEMSTPFSGNQPYTASTSAILINGVQANLSAITLTDANGGGYTYFKLRDLGQALGFDVDWDNNAKAIIIDTTKPYSE